MSVHQFDTELAKEYGIESAILLQNILFWIEKNKANGAHFHDGSYWTYNSIKAFSELFTYMSESTIRRTLKTIEEAGIIKTGNYNKAGYDRTTWYSITEKGFCILNKSILSKQQMELPKTTNGFNQSSEPIPDIKPSKKQDKQVCNKLKEIYDTYISEYEKLNGRKPDLIYKITTKRIGQLKDSVSEDQIIHAIKEAGYDDWIIKAGFDLMMILSDKVLPRLVNSSFSKPPKPLSPKEKLLCPRCGAEVIAGLCTKCRIPVDSDGKELK